MKHLQEPAAEYAQKNFPMFEGCNNGIDAIKHDIAYHSFADGFNEAMRILMDIGNIKNIDTNIHKPGSIDWEEESVWEEE